MIRLIPVNHYHIDPKTKDICPSHRTQSHKLLQHGFFPWCTVLHGPWKGSCCSFPLWVTGPSRKSVPAWAPLLGPQLLLGVCSCVGSPQIASSLRAHDPSLDPLQAAAWISSTLALRGLLQLSSPWSSP